MSSFYGDREKTGYKKMLDLAKVLCRLVNDFEAIIRGRFPDSLPILALLDAIKALCLLLPEAEDAFLQETTNVAPPVASPEDTPGYDPSSPDPVDPEFT